MACDAGGLCSKSSTKIMIDKTAPVIKVVKFYSNNSYWTVTSSTCNNVSTVSSDISCTASVKQVINGNLSYDYDAVVTEDGSGVNGREYVWSHNGDASTKCGTLRTPFSSSTFVTSCDYHSGTVAFNYYDCQRAKDNAGNYSKTVCVIIQNG